MPCPTPSLGHERRPIELSRRVILAGVGVGFLPGLALGQPVELTRRGTPQMGIGPFYPLDRPVDQDWDMTSVPGRSGAAHGVIMELVGRVTTEAGEPVAGAVIDVWQTNGFGRYHHPSDPMPQALDPNFQGSAVIRTDADGDYRLRTVIPLPYARRQRHIHFDVRGARRRLITQMFFPGEPNDRDSLYHGLQSEALQRAVTAELLGERDGARHFSWNIALAGE